MCQDGWRRRFTRAGSTPYERTVATNVAARRSSRTVRQSNCCNANSGLQVFVVHIERRRTTAAVLHSYYADAIQCRNQAPNQLARDSQSRAPGLRFGDPGRAHDD